MRCICSLKAEEVWGLRGTDEKRPGESGQSNASVPEQRGGATAMAREPLHRKTCCEHPNIGRRCGRGNQERKINYGGRKVEGCEGFRGKKKVACVLGFQYHVCSCDFPWPSEVL